MLCVVVFEQNQRVVIIKCAYLSAKLSGPDLLSLPLFSADILVKLWIINHSVPFRLADRREHLGTLFWRSVSGRNVCGRIDGSHGCPVFGVIWTSTFG